MELRMVVYTHEEFMAKIEADKKPKSKKTKVVVKPKETKKYGK